MPSKSKSQHSFMEAIAHNPKFSKKVGVPQSVGKDFSEADKGREFRKGGSTNPTKQGINNPRTNHGQMQMPNYSLLKYSGKKEGGIMKPVDAKKNPGMAKLPTAVRNKMGYMKEGGKADMSQDKKMVKKAVGMHDKQMHGGKKTDMSMLKKGGMAPKKMAAGGSAGSFRTSAGGINTKGKTKGTIIKMKNGGGC